MVRLRRKARTQRTCGEDMHPAAVLRTRPKTTEPLLGLSRRPFPTMPSRSARLLAWRSPLRREQQQLIGCLCQKESSPQENGPGCIRRGHQVSSPDGETMRPSEDARLHSVASSGGQALRQIKRHRWATPQRPRRGGRRRRQTSGGFSPEWGGLWGAKNDLGLPTLISSGRLEPLV